MKKSLLAGLVLLNTSVFAVEGYKDIYIDGNKDIYIHTIYCAKDANNMAAFKPSVVYTNTKSIEDGTYYMDSAYGEYSISFKKIKGSTAVRARGTLTKGATQASQMKKEVCLVEKNAKIPKSINGRIKTDLLKSNDPKWNDKMKGLTAFLGKPAYAKGKYLTEK